MIFFKKGNSLAEKMFKKFIWTIHRKRFQMANKHMKT